MHKVEQTRTGGPDNPDGEHGNCLQAAIASILELPLEIAPDLSDFPDDWWDTLQEWAAILGYYFLNFESSYTIEDLQGWLKGPAMVGVKSINGDYGHMIVVSPEEVWNPSPNRDKWGGSYEITDMWVLLPLNPAHMRLKPQVVRSGGRG